MTDKKTSRRLISQNDQRQYWQQHAIEYGSVCQGWLSVLPSEWEYGLHYIHALHSRHIFNLIQIYPREKILDIGCGPGRFCHEFALKGAEVTGVDFSEQMITLAKENLEREGLGGEFLVKAASEIDFPDNTFDLVTSIMMFQHILDAKTFHKSCQQIVRVTKPGGEILLLEQALMKEPKHYKLSHMAYRPFKEWVAAFEGEGTRLLRVSGVEVVELEKHYCHLCSRIARWLLRKNLISVDETVEQASKDASLTYLASVYEHSFSTPLFYSIRKAIITISKPFNFYLAPLPLFRRFSEMKVMLFRKDDSGSCET